MITYEQFGDSYINEVPTVRCPVCQSKAPVEFLPKQQCQILYHLDEHRTVCNGTALRAHMHKMSDIQRS